jgi:hypothetical protein
MVPLTGMLCGALGVTLAGWFGTRGLLAQPPLQTIRKLA